MDDKDAIRRIALEDIILGDGPLPNNWYLEAAVTEDRVPFVKWRFVSFGPRAGISDTHPSRLSAQDLLDRETIFTSRASVGAFHPEQMRLSDFKWSNASTSVSSAFAGSLKPLWFHRGQQHPPLTHEVASVLEDITFDDRHSTQLYNPLYRAGEHGASQPIHPGEIQLALLAHHYGFALVVVDTQAESINDFMGAGTVPRRAVVRFSVNADSELMPPIHIGRCIGKWFSLQIRDSENYSRWLPESYDWSEKAALLHGKGSRLNVAGLMFSVASIVSSIRTGFSLNGREDNNMDDNLSLDAAVMALGEAVLQGRSVRDFFDTWDQFGSMGQGIIKLSWALRAIACSDQALPKQITRLWMRASSIAANPTSTNPFTAEEIAMLHTDARLFTDQTMPPIIPTVRPLPPIISQPHAAGPSVQKHTFTSPSTLGTFTNATTASRLKFSVISQRPCFELSVRQNFFQGDDLKNAQALVRSGGPKLTKHGQDASQYSDDYVEESYLFDLNDLSHFNMRVIDRYDLAITQTGIARPPGASRFGKMELRFKDGRFPTHSRLNSNVFHPDSDQHTFALAAATSKSFTVIVNLDHPKYRYHASFQSYMELATKLRMLTLSGRPCNDWFLARDPDFRADHPHSLAKFADRALPIPEWLVDGKEYQLAHHTDKDDIPVRTFITAHDHYMCHTKAILQERDHRLQQHEEQYNDANDYTVHFHLRGQFDCTADIRLLTDGIITGQMIVPLPETAITLTVRSLGRDDPLILVGKVLPLASEGYDIKVAAPLPEPDDQHLLKLSSLEDVMTSLDWQDKDFDTQLKLAAVSDALTVCTGEPPAVQRITIDGKVISSFWLRDLLIGQHVPTWGPNMVDFLQSRLQPDERQDRMITFEKLRSESKLTSEQLAVVDTAIGGSYMNVVLMEGCPGSGKSYCLSVLIVMLLRLNCKVVIVSQSNVGVSALFQQVTALIEQKPELHDLRPHCLRFRSHKVETHDVERMLGYAEIEDNAPPPNQYSMAAAIHHFVQLNPRHELSLRLHRLLACRRNGSKPPNGLPSVEETIKSIQVRVFETLLCVAATMAMSTFLKDIGFQADAAIMDEASQATESDILMTITNQELLQLLLVVGDIQQLGPVVQSASARRNTHGNFLTTSALARFIKCHPHADHLKLMTNFRADPSLVPMPSELSYGGKMVSGRPSNTGPLTQRVLRLLQGREFTGATKSRRPLSAGSRQVFFDTKSNSHQDPCTRSTINANGVRLLVEFAGRLVNEAQVKQKDIGIISMYKMDMLEIKKQLRDNDLPDIEVTTVDGFQGRDKHIMLVHFVAARHCSKVGQNPFGFIKDAKRLIVALTRAREFQFLFGSFGIWSNWQAAVRMQPEVRDTAAYEHMFGLMRYVSEKGQLIDGDLYKRARGMR